MSDLITKYGIKQSEALFCDVVRKIRGAKRCPNFILKMSKKRYGWNDNLGRYWNEKFNNVKIGKYTYGYEYLNSKHLLSVGAFSSIAPRQYIIPNDHRVDFVTTSPVAQAGCFGFVTKKYEVVLSDEKRKIIVGNDVWIGANCIIFEGVTIGDGAVIAAGSIVRKDVPPYAVIGSVDKIIKYRFSPVTIAKLLKIQWWNWEDNKIRENIRLLQDVEKFVERFYEE